MINKEYSNKVRLRKHKRVRKKVAGTVERPRLCVFRSLGHIYAQIIDDISGHTLVQASTMDKDLAYKEFGGNIKAAEAVGKLVAIRAQAEGIKKVVFDRGGYIYHGRIKALADAARNEGLDF